MDTLLPVLETLGVAFGAFLVLCAVVSYARYRQATLDAQTSAETGGLMPESAVLLILEAVRKGRFSILHLIPAGEGSVSGDVSEMLARQLRKSDTVYLLSDQSVLILLNTSAQHVPTVANRLKIHLNTVGVKGGLFRCRIADGDPSGLKDWLMTDQPSPSPGIWTGPEVPESFPVEQPPPPESSENVDPLTGVLRTERATLAVRREMAAYRRSSRPVSLMRFDVDHLEHYNRDYGRETGDQLLKQVADLLMTHCRESDLIGRLEEDEFVLCLAGNAERGLQVAERLSNCVKERAFQLNTGTLRATVTCGLASYPEHGQNPGVLFNQAGWALAAAKRRGRGVCMVSEPGMKPAEGSPQGRDGNEPVEEQF